MKLAEALHASPRSGSAVNRTGKTVLLVTVWDDDFVTQEARTWVVAVRNLNTWEGDLIYDGCVFLEEVEDFLADPSNSPPTHDADTDGWEPAPWEPTRNHTGR